MALPTGRGSLHRGRSVETGGAQRGPRAVAPAWVAGIEGEGANRGADVGPENTDCQRFGGPGPRSLPQPQWLRLAGPGADPPPPGPTWAGQVAICATHTAQVALGCARATAADSLSLGARSTPRTPATAELSAARSSASAGQG